MAAVRTARGALEIIGVGGLAAAALFAADRVTLIPGAARLVITSLFCVTAVAFLYARVAAPALRRPTPTEAARALEARYAQLGGFALSAAQLALSPETASSGPSETLVEMTVEEALRRTQGTDPRKAANAKVINRPLAATLLALSLWTAAGLFLPADTAAFLRRFTDPLGAAAYQTRTRIVSITVMPLWAGGVMPKDESFDAEVKVEGLLPAEAVFEVTGEDKRRNRIYSQGDVGRYTMTLERVSASFSFHVVVGDARSEERFYKVVPRPAVETIEAEAAYPSYTGVGRVTMPTGDITAAVGSTATVTASFNKPVGHTSVKFDSGGYVEGRPADDLRSAVYEFDVKESDSYRIVLQDEYGFGNMDDARWQVRAVEDASPMVTLTRPGRDMTVVADAVIPLEAQASDDYGVERLFAAYSVRRGGAVVSQGTIPMTQADGGRRSASASVKWKISGLVLAEGDEVRYWAEANDNHPDMPHVARSDDRAVRVVSVAEKLSELEQISRQVQGKIFDAAARQEKARVPPAGEEEVSP